MKKYKNLIIISILIIIVLFLYFKNKKEHLLVGTEPVLNIAKIYADASGTATFNDLKANKITTNNIDLSGNMTVNNLKVINNLDVSGSLNVSKAYYTCTLQGQLNKDAINNTLIDGNDNGLSAHLRIINVAYWSSYTITGQSYDKNKIIVNDFQTGVLSGFDINKVYKLEAYISLCIKDTQGAGDYWVARWKRGNAGDELTSVIVPVQQDNMNLTLTTIVFATGSELYNLTLQKKGKYVNQNGPDASITIVVSEM
jgi:hypothetical protein